MFNLFDYKGITVAEIDEEAHSKLMEYWNDDEKYETGEKKLSLPDKNITNYICYFEEKRGSYWDAICVMEMPNGYHLFGQSFIHKENALRWIANEYIDTDELIKEDEKGITSMEKIYGVTITETSSKTLAVKANSLDEAFEIIEDAYRNEEIVFDWNDFDEYEISALPYSAEDGSITEKDAQYYEHFNF